VISVPLSKLDPKSALESTARDAYERGYNVALVVDAMTDLAAEVHENSVKHILPRLGESTNTETILELLSARHT
jgi:nicotinamidase-related amidase